MPKPDVLLAIHNFSELKSLANDTKIRPSLKFLLIQYKNENSDLQVHFFLIW